MAINEPVIGIDLGTTNCVIATVQGGRAIVIKNRMGNNLTPSVVAHTKAGKILVGALAKRQAVTNPSDTVYAAKRLIGRKFSADQTQKALTVFPYCVCAGEHDDIRILLGERKYTLPEISAFVLQELKADAEAFWGAPVNKAVVTVPAYFHDGQRQATKDAGRIAGLNVLRIINEPTAAALAYGFGKTINGKIAVFDLGGGTFDVSVLEIGNGVFDVIATGGDTYLGGEDFDAEIMNWLVNDFEQQNGINLLEDRMVLQRLKEASEKAKIELSTAHEVQINLPFIVTPPEGGPAMHLHKVLTREQLNQMCGHFVRKAITICEQVLQEAKVKPIDLREMLLVGGMTRMPAVQAAVKEYFRRDCSKGAHPDEVVALGAAVQADMLVSTATEVVLLDVTPQSLGVVVAGGYMRRLIPRNTTVPTSVTEIFHTSRDNQDTVKIMVLQGEEELAHKNELLGEFTMAGIRKATRGEVGIEVTFEINSEGIALVSARDKETGKKQSIQVTASSGLTQEELDTILSEKADMLLEAKEGEEIRKKSAELKRLITEATGLFQRLQEKATGSSVGPEWLSKAEKELEQAHGVAAQQDLRQIVTNIDIVARIISVLKGVIG